MLPRHGPARGPGRENTSRGCDHPHWIARYGSPSSVSTRVSDVTSMVVRALPTASICTDRSMALAIQAFSLVARATFESTGYTSSLRSCLAAPRRRPSTANVSLSRAAEPAEEKTPLAKTSGYGEHVAPASQRRPAPFDA